MQKKKIVIIGGGFGGIYVGKGLKRLVKKRLADITILNRNNYFTFTPLLHEVATGGLSSLSVTESIREIFKKTPINFVQSEVLKVDPEAKKVETDKGNFDYDFLVVSTGATTKFSNIPGAEKNTIALKNLSDALKIRSQIINAFEKASIEENPEKRKRLLTFVVVGSGATGVELAAELSEFVFDTLCPFYKKTFCNKNDFRIFLISSRESVLPSFPLKMRTWAYSTLIKKNIEIIKNSRVSEVTENNILLSDGEKIESQNIFWTAGVSPQLPNFLSDIPTEKGRIKTTNFLNIEGFEEIFSIGDSSYFLQNGKELPMFAQVAVAQAKNVSKNIKNLILNKDLVSFKYRSKGVLVSVGQWMAIGDIFGVKVRGKLVWWVWRTIYLFKFASLRKRLRIAFEWTINIFYSRDITRIG